MMVFLAAMRRQNRAPASVKKKCYAWLVMTDDKIQSQVVCGATGINRQIAFIAAQGLLPLRKGMALLNA
ncbi:TPA: hypothetical protein MIH07_25400 [Klebsiella pneumoniae]|nr:hypothetical protein [Klebsiella pneumoniae]